MYTATFADKTFGDDGVVTDTVQVEPLGHNWDVGVITKKRTCAEDGVRTYTCKRCGTTRTETLPTFGHSPTEPIIENEVLATCVEAGSFDEVVYCMSCEKELSREHVAVEPLGHDWGEAVYEWSDDLSTCTAARTCNRGEPHVQVAPGSVAFEMTKEPTATEPGERTYTATFEADWAQTQTATSEIPPTGDEAIIYQATKGSVTWTKGSGGKLSFTYERSQQNDLTFSLFTGVLVDGQEVPQGSYDAYSGSVVIELSPDYLETLAAGAHTLQPTFQDGVGDEVTFTIAEAAKPDEGGSVKPDEGGSKADGNGNGNSGSSGGTAASTKPASSTSKVSAASAKTGDALPIAAVCTLIVLGLVVAIVAFRKSRK